MDGEVFTGSIFYKRLLTRFPALVARAADEVRRMAAIPGGVVCAVGYRFLV